LAERAVVAHEVVEALGAICLGLPEAYEEQAWVGTRWRVGTRTFAHVLAVDSGWPPAYARASGSDGPLTVMMFRSSGAELAALAGAGHPFFTTPWRADEIGMVLGDDVDWVEIRELITESYCVMAPQRLVDQLDRPTA
jgi:YjbR